MIFDIKEMDQKQKSKNFALRVQLTEGKNTRQQIMFQTKKNISIRTWKKK
jgi:hypothetical protein